MFLPQCTAWHEDMHASRKKNSGRNFNAVAIAAGKKKVEWVEVEVNWMYVHPVRYFPYWECMYVYMYVSYNVCTYV